MDKQNKAIENTDSSFIEEMIPLNTELYSDFSLDELEERLEMEAWGCVKCSGGSENNGCSGVNNPPGE